MSVLAGPAAAIASLNLRALRRPQRTKTAPSSHQSPEKSGGRPNSLFSMHQNASGKHQYSFINELLKFSPHARKINVRLTAARPEHR
jgi:hypothetical protein